MLRERASVNSTLNSILMLYLKLARFTVKLPAIATCLLLGAHLLEVHAQGRTSSCDLPYKVHICLQDNKTALLWVKFPIKCPIFPRVQVFKVYPVSSPHAISKVYPFSYS